MNYTLQDKTAIVCGSTQGIGKATAIALAKAGCRIVLIARDEQKLASVCAELQEVSDQQHTYLVADFSSREALQKVLSSHDDGPIHILVNNTGGPPSGQAINAEVSDFIKAFEMHLLCNHILVGWAVKHMRQAGYGRIINVISTSVKQPLPNLGVSNTIRGAVANWSKTLANELGKYDITVNNVLPGATATARLESIARRKSDSSGASVQEVIKQMGQKVPLGRVGKPEEIADAICFLAGPGASYISGINLPVDGGRTACL